MKNIGYSLGYRDQATASIELSGAGDLKQATVRVGIADLGQGSSLALRQIAAETLALPLEQITLISHDSSQAPDAGGTSASRTTFIAGRAVKEAALDARKKWEETDDEYISATKHYLAPLTTPIMGGGQPNLCYGYAAQAIEVEVNMLTGQVRVVKVISVHDAGRIINPQRVEGQIEGGIAQALGFTLLEDFQCREGHVLTSDFTTYLLPTIADMPEEIIPVVLELADPDGPYGARGIAEMSLLPFAPAVAHAIYAATGVWINQLPMTPERVMQKLQERENNL
jgi:CO/xanthine dehydrogenase Mo-binding subunit